MKIVVLGYMASGKSTIGKLLSQQLNIDFVDLDEYIENNEKKSVKEIFKTDGEIYFRKKEHEYLKEILASTNNFVLSLGGGTPCYADNMTLISKSDAVSVYLQANIPTLVNRLISEKENRPLIASLNDEQLTEYVAKHLFERRPFYEKTKNTLKIDGKNIPTIVSELKALLF